MNKIWIWVFSILGLFVIVYLAYVFTNTPLDKTFPELTKINSSDHVKWASGSANILVEYSDLQCPACQSFNDYINQNIQASGSANHTISAKVTFVYRHFPLTQHAFAEPAAYAAEAAGIQGKFFEYLDLLFARQKDWAESKDAPTKFESYAKELKLNLDKFKADRELQKVKDKVQSDFRSGQEAGVNSTPTFYLNGKKIGPINSFEDFLKPLKDL